LAHRYQDDESLASDADKPLPAKELRPASGSLQASHA